MLASRCAAIRGRVGLHRCLQHYGLNFSIRITVIFARVFRLCLIRLSRRVLICTCGSRRCCRCGSGIIRRRCRRRVCGCCRCRCRCRISRRCCRCRVCGCCRCRCRISRRCGILSLRESRRRHKRKRHCQQQAQQNKFAQFLVHTLPPIISAHFEFLNYVYHQMMLWSYCTMYE